MVFFGRYWNVLEPTNVVEGAGMFWRAVEYQKIYYIPEIYFNAIRTGFQFSTELSTQLEGCRRVILYHENHLHACIHLPVHSYIRSSLAWLRPRRSWLVMKQGNESAMTA